MEYCTNYTPKTAYLLCNILYYYNIIGMYLYGGQYGDFVYVWRYNAL